MINAMDSQIFVTQTKEKHPAQLLFNDKHPNSFHHIRRVCSLCVPGRAGWESECDVSLCEQGILFGHPHMPNVTPSNVSFWALCDVTLPQ